MREKAKFVNKTEEEEGRSVPNESFDFFFFFLGGGEVTQIMQIKIQKVILVAYCFHGLYSYTVSFYLCFKLKNI